MPEYPTLDTLQNAVKSAARNLPEVRDEALAALRDLRAVSSAGITGDERLFGLDAKNLAEGLERISRLREAGCAESMLTGPLANTLLLIADMRRRAALIVQREAEMVDIHTEVAASTCANADTADVTPALKRLLACAPVSADDAPLTVLPTGLDPNGEMSGVTGDLRVLTVAPSTNSAPPEAVVLPAGHVLRFSPGEAFIIHASGLHVGEDPDVPRARDAVNVVVEAGPGGAVLSGPAVLTIPALGDTALGGFDKATTVITRALTEEHNIRAEEDEMLTGVLWSAIISSVSFVILLLNSETIFTPAGLLCVGSLGIAAFSLMNRQIIDKRIRTLREFDTTGLWAEVRSVLKNAEAEMGDYFRPGGIERVFNANTLWTLPVTHTRAQRGSGLRVLKPLVALPAPNPADGIFSLKETQSAR